MKMKTISQQPLSIDGDSVPFIVGDMLKRNYPLLDKFYKKVGSPRPRYCRSSEKGKRIAIVEPS